MTTYAAGFAQGERDAFTDRRDGVGSEYLPKRKDTDYTRGYWDGYTPRSATWAAVRHSPAPTVDEVVYG